MRNLIFDMDGTLLDSMPFWRNVSREYATSQGMILPDDFDERTYTMSFEECNEYLHKELGYTKTTDEMKADILERMNWHYLNDIPMKSGMKELLIKEHMNGSRICIFTASDRSCVENVFARFGVLDCFEQIFTVSEVGISKTSPESFEKICSLMEFKPEETYVYEDTIHSMESAVKAGCKVIGVYDEQSDEFWDRAKQICIQTIEP